MGFTFLHTADWQLGKPFRTFDDKLAAVLEDERFNVIDRLAAAARSAGARHVLVAGDVFDSEMPRESTLRRPLDRMAAASDLAWHLLPGNHDPARPGGVWERLLSLGLPSNLVAHLTPGVSLIASDVALLTAPLTAKGYSTDPTEPMDAAPSPAGAIRIGLAHGSIRSFAGGSSEPTAVIDPTRARKAGLAYLALGDWHGKLRIDDRTWYSGTPEPDRFAGNEPGFALAVTIDGAAAPSVTPVATGRFSWASHGAELGRGAGLDSIERVIGALAPALDRLLLKLTLTGSLPAGDHAAVQAWSRALAPRLRHLELIDTDLRIRSSASDLASLATAPDLKRAAERLQRMADDVDEPRHAAARRALARLHDLAAGAVGAEGA